MIKAVRTGFKRVAKLLIEKGAHVNAIANCDQMIGKKTDALSSCNSKGMARYLLKHGANVNGNGNVTILILI